MKVKLIVVLVAALIASCSSSKKKTETASVSGRKGDVLTNYDKKYFDAQPAISADGEKVAFISGRDGNDQLKVYKTTIASVDVVRATDSDDLGIETDVRINAGGDWLLIKAVREGKEELWLQSFGDNTLRSQVPLDAEMTPSEFLIGPGTTPFVFYVQVDQDGAKTLWAVHLQSATAPLTWSTPVKIDSYRVSESGFALKDNGGGSLTLTSTLRENGTVTVRHRTFAATDLSDLAEVDTAVPAAVPIQDNVLEVDATHVGMVTANTDSTRSLVPEGDKAATTDVPDPLGKVSIQSEWSWFDLTANTLTVVPSKQYHVAQAAYNADLNIASVLGTELFVCQNKEIYGRTLVLQQPSGTSSQRILIGYNSDDKTWRGITNLCEQYTTEAISAGKLPVDLKTLTVQIAKNGTELRVFTSTRYFGDTEVLITKLTDNNGEWSVSEVANLSNNHP